MNRNTTEVYRLVTRGTGGIETYVELDPQASEAEAEAAWDIAQRMLRSGNVVQLVRVSTTVLASASRG